MDAPSSPPILSRRFRWLQFSMRTLLLAILAAALGLGWYSRELRRRERVERAIDLMVKSPNPLGWGYDPAALVRAVNALHSLGKEDAIAALRRFAAENPNDGYTSPHQSLELVVPLLFDRVEPEDLLPASDWEGTNFSLTLEQWYNDVSVEGDLPFHTLVIGGTSGWPSDKDYLVEWAARQGAFRSTPLRPADDPLAAVDSLVERLYRHSDREEKLDEWLLRHIRGQAFRMVAPSFREDPEDSELFPADDAGWSRLKERCSRLGIRWSEEKQQYVATKGKE